MTSSYEHHEHGKGDGFTFATTRNPAAAGKGDWMDIDAMFEEASEGDEFLNFKAIPSEQRRHVRPDLCAFLYLHERFGGKTGHTGEQFDMINGAGHEEIWLSYSEDDLKGITKEDVVYLSRCGVRYDSDNDSLCMFV